MTAFTPPTEFPHECLNQFGDKVTLFALDSDGNYAGLCHSSSGRTFADIRGPSGFRDLPKVTRTWENIYQKTVIVAEYDSRSDADKVSGPDRIGVLRRDTIDGVTTCTLEDV